MKKSKFFKTDIIFAGARVSLDGVEPDSTKLTTVINWHQHPNLPNLSHFLGLMCHFHNLIKNYAQIAQPLLDLIHSVNISKGASKATYCAALSKVKLANIWTHTDGTPFIVTSDSCKDRFGGMLAQLFSVTHPSGRVVKKQHPITYASKQTSPAEAQYQPFLR